MMIRKHYLELLDYEDYLTYTVLLADDERVAAYKSAINEIVTPGMQVVELGAGPGVFGRYAAKLGASTIMVDRGDKAIKVCSLLNEALAPNESIVLKKNQVENVILPFCDVVIHEMIGGRIMDEGLLPMMKSFTKNNRWFTGHDTRVIPNDIELWAKFIRVNDQELTVGNENIDTNDSPLLWVSSTSDYASCSEWFKIANYLSKEANHWPTSFKVSNIEISKPNANALLWGFVANLTSFISLDARIGIGNPTTWGGDRRNFTK